MNNNIQEDKTLVNEIGLIIKESAELDNVPVLLFSIYKEHFLKALPSEIEEIPDKYTIETARKSAFGEVMKVCEEQDTYQDTSLAEFIQKEDFSNFRIVSDTEGWIMYKSDLGYWQVLSSDRELKKHVNYLLNDFRKKMKILIPEKERTVRLNTAVLSLGSAHKEKSVISKLSSLSKELKTEDLDKSTSEYFLCKNGVIDVRSGKLLDFSPDFYFGSPGLNGTYRPGVESDVLDSIFSSLDNESDKYLRRLIGAAFLGIKSDRLTVLQGSGSNGKSVILNLLNAVGGGYVKVIDSALLREDSSYHTAELSGVNLAIIEEVGSVLDMQKIKAIADTETITAREIYKSPCRFTNKVAMFTTTNDLPELANVATYNNSINRRLSLIKFEKEYSYNPRGNQLLADPGIIEAIEKRDEDLFSATINLIVDKARSYLEDKTILHSERPEKVEKATDAWINSQSPSAEILSMLEGVPEGEEDSHCLPLIQLVHLVKATGVLGTKNVSAQTVRSIIEEDLKKVFPKVYIKDGGSRIPVKAEISNYHIADNKLNSTHSKTRGVLMFGCKIKEEFRE